MRISDWSSDVCSSDLEDRSGRCGAVDAQALDHACGIGAAVDEIAEKHDECLASVQRCHVRFDPAKQDVEEVEPAVHVADRISARAGLAAHGRRRLLLSKYLPEEKHLSSAITVLELSLAASRPTAMMQIGRAHV